MPGNSNDQSGLTRREYVACGGTVVAGGLLSGCTGSSSSDPPESGTATGTTATTTESEPTDTAATDKPYRVTVEPAGEVAFETVPQTWVAENASWADMASHSA